MFFSYVLPTGLHLFPFLPQGDGVLRLADVPQSISSTPVAKQEVICLDSSASASEDDTGDPVIKDANDGECFLSE